MRYSHQGIRRSHSTSRRSKAPEGPKTEPPISPSSVHSKRVVRQSSTRRSGKLRRQSSTGRLTTNHRRGFSESTTRNNDAVDGTIDVDNNHSSSRTTLIKLPDSTHRCKICGRQFDRPSQLKAHLLEHSNERPYPCFTCNIRFTTKWNLMKHQKCRSHRVVQARVAGNAGDRTKSARFVPIKKRKLDWTQPTQSVHTADSTIGDSKETVQDLKESICLNVLPFASPIATQLQASRLSQLNGDLKPKAVLVGMLHLDLPSHQKMQIPVSVTSEELKRCLSSLRTASAQSTLQDRVRDVGSQRNKIADKFSSDSHPLDSESTHIDKQSSSKSVKRSPSSSSKPGSDSQDSTVMDSDKLNTRTQEELQAARIILSLANSGDMPCELKHNGINESEGEKLHEQSGLLTDNLSGDSEKDCQTVRSDASCSRSRPVTPLNVRDHGGPEEHSFSNHFNSSVFRDELSFTPRKRRTNDSTAAVVTNTRADSSMEQLISSPCALSSVVDAVRSDSTQTTPPVGSMKCRKQPGMIRPPPKKRLSAHYQRTPSISTSSETSSGSITTLPSETKPMYTNPPITTGNAESDSASHAPTKVQAIATTVPTSVTTATPNSFCSTVIRETVTCASQSVSSNVAFSTPVSKVLQDPNITCTVPVSSQIIVQPPLSTQSFTIPTPVQYGSLPGCAPNVVILPPLMFLPRIISPYIPVAGNQSMVTSCYLVQSDATVRGPSAMSSTVTDALVTPIPTAVREPNTTAISPTSNAKLNASVARPTDHNTVVTILPKDPSMSNRTGVPFLSERSIQSAGGPAHSPVIYTSTTAHSQPSANGESVTSVTKSVARSVTDARAPQNLTATKSNDLTSNRLISIRPSNIALQTSKLGDRTNCPPHRSLLTSRLLASRNKYRCYECGLVCHKPCLLRKHYRTHSNLRPYICQHCDVSFKTRGNLSKHMKSRGHHDRCIRDLGLDQAPVVVDDATQVDQQALERQRQLVLKKDHVKRDLWLSRFRAIKANPQNPIGRSRRIALGTRSTRSVSRRSRRRQSAVASKHDGSTSTTSVLSPPSTGAQSTSSTPGPVEKDFSARIPAPNVNAVHLLQDLPLNLSLRPREATVVIPYQLDLTATTSRHCLTSASSSPLNSVTPAGQITAVSKVTALDAEEIVRTAVAAARTLGTDKSQMVPNSTTVLQSVTEQVNLLSPSNPLENLSRVIHQTRATTSTHSSSTTVGPYTLLSSGHPNRTSMINLHSHSQSSAPQAVGSPSINSPSNGSLSQTVINAQTRNAAVNSSCKAADVIANGNGCSTLSGMPIILRKHADSPSEVRRTVTPSNRGRDPRPYKCTTCQIGFRVTGHLHKHYRAKSHLVCVLQSHNLSLDTIESVRRNRFNVSQIVNPDTGQLRMRAIERLQATKPNTSTTQPNATATTTRILPDSTAPGTK